VNLGQQRGVAFRQASREVIVKRSLRKEKESEILSERGERERGERETDRGSVTLRACNSMNSMTHHPSSSDLQRV
jgi:hypothetical protein